MPEYGKTILINDHTGDPYLDPDGNLVLIEGENLLRQSLDVLLNTKTRDEFFGLEYGLDFYGMMDGDYGRIPRIALMEMFADAIENSGDPLFVQLNWIDMTGLTDSTATVRLGVECTGEIEIETNVEYEE